MEANDENIQDDQEESLLDENYFEDIEYLDNSHDVDLVEDVECCDNTNDVVCENAFEDIEFATTASPINEVFLTLVLCLMFCKKWNQ